LGCWAARNGPPFDPGLPEGEPDEPHEGREHAQPEPEPFSPDPILAGDDFEEIGRQANPGEKLADERDVHVNPGINSGRHPRIIHARPPSQRLEYGRENVLDDCGVLCRPDERLDQSRGHIGDDPTGEDLFPGDRRDGTGLKNMEFSAVPGPFDILGRPRIVGDGAGEVTQLPHGWLV
jgi:hypothetical protein